MNEIIVLAKIKFDLRDPDEAYFAQYELSAILGSEVKPIETIPALFKYSPFNKLSDNIIHIMTRNLYLGEIQGYLAKVKKLDAYKLVSMPAFFREIYLILEVPPDGGEDEIRQMLSLDNENLCQIFETDLGDGKRIFTVKLLPLQTLFEYVSDVKKLPAVAIKPRNTETWSEYFAEKEDGINRGLDDLLEYLRSNQSRAPHFGLGKKHIGDFIDWASTDLRKPFLHYIHKYKGKGDPRISRALINLLRVNKDEIILDPFVGSGAFIADAPTMGLNAIGIEILEIGRLVSEVKCDLSYDIEKLRAEVITLFSISNYSSGGLFSFNDDNIRQIITNLESLTSGNKFFTNILPHLESIVYLKGKIEEIQDEKIRKFLLVLLSQKIVEFSEKKKSINFITSFKDYVEDRYLTLYATLMLADKLNVNITDGEVKIIKADSTDMKFVSDSSIDGILTSPPYFDALDYIENNKFSAIILGFYEDLKFGSTKEYYSKFAKYNLGLPESNINLVNFLKESERSMKAEIVENYLKMMKLSFRECYRVLKPNKFYVMVVSKYHTWAINGTEKRIETSRILADLGISEGFKLMGIIQHGLSKADKGKINVEDILLFQK